jgi:hypothetical protein
MTSSYNLSKKRYRVLDGKTSVELKLKTPRQLFDERDPAPFRERDLDDDAARYIVGSFRDVKDQGAVKLSIYFETLGEFIENPALIEKAIHAFFLFEAEGKRRELRDIFRKGFISLLIGMSFLFLCTWSAQAFDSAKSVNGLLGSAMHEGLFIMGWVAMWQPISIFLYEWWPIREAQKTFQRLGAIEVQVLSPGQVEAQERRVSDAVLELSRQNERAFSVIGARQPMKQPI